LVVEETYAVSPPVAAALGGAPMLRRLSLRWLFPLTLLVLLLASCGDTADDSADTTIAPTTTTTATPITTTAAPITTSTAETTTSAPPSTTEPVGELFEVTYVEGEGCTSVGPSVVSTGIHSFVLHDPTGELDVLYIIRADEDRTLQDAIDAQPAPGKWYAKPSWLHHTVDLGSEETDDGMVFAKLLNTPGPHLVLAGLYYGVPTADERIWWICSPSFTVVESTE
jgi:hypothetical protein